MSNITEAEEFTLKQSGNIGQEIVSPRGKILAWTTNAVFGTFLVRILNDFLGDDELVAAVCGEEWSDEQ